MTTIGTSIWPAPPITQAHPTGYPLYRLEWQSLGSLQRRLRNCMIGIRAQPYDYGAPELVDLELYLMSRARGHADRGAGGETVKTAGLCPAAILSKGRALFRRRRLHFRIET